MIIETRRLAGWNFVSLIFIASFLFLRLCNLIHDLRQLTESSIKMVIWCRKELLYVLVVCLGSMGIGEVGTYNSPAGQPLAADLGLSETQLSIFNAIAHLCAALGGFAVDFVMKRVGRKNSAIIGITGTLLGWIVLAMFAGTFSGLHT